MGSDEELVALAVAGDRDAFGALYDRYATPVHDLLCRMLGSPHDAADALQDTFVTAGERLHQLRDPSRFRAWIYAIARRRAYLATERRSRFSSLEDTDVPTTELDPSDHLAAAEYRALIEDASGGLDERDRILLDLQVRHGLDGEDLADAMGVDRGHVHVLAHRVRAKLERSIGVVVLARHGRVACPELSAVLGAWDGTLTPTIRKRVSRHADGCDGCSAERERRLRPEVLLGLTPFAPAPAGAREVVLDRVELCSHQGAPWPGPDGFPPDLAPPAAGPTPHRLRSRRGALLTLVFLLAMAGALAVWSSLAGDGGRVPEELPATPAADSDTTDGPETSLAPADPAEPVPVTVSAGDASVDPTRPPATRRPGGSAPTTRPTTSTTAPASTTSTETTTTTASTTTTSTTTTTTRPTDPPPTDPPPTDPPPTDPPPTDPRPRICDPFCDPNSGFGAVL